MRVDDGDPGWIRTTGPQIRNLVLYPTELRDHLCHLAPGLTANTYCVNILHARYSGSLPSKGLIYKLIASFASQNQHLDSALVGI